jgi:hypothetical protein
VAREGVAAPCRAVAEQPSGRPHALRRLRIERLTLRTSASSTARRRACRFALGHGLVPRRVEEIGKLLNTVNQPGARTRPRRVRIHRNDTNPRG